MQKKDEGSKSAPVKSGGIFAALSIKRKLVLMIMLVSSLAMLTAGGAFYAYQWVGFRQRILADLATQGEMLANNLKAAISFKDFRDAGSVLGSLEAKRPIVLACIYDEEGNVFASYKRRDIDLKPPPLEPGAEGYRFEREWVIRYQKIMLDGRHIGTIYLQSDMSELSAFLKQSTLILALLIFLVSLASFALSSKLQGLISRPLFHLANISRKVSQSGDYTVRASKISDDETGLLTDAFNNMLTQIQKRNEELRRDEEELRRLRNLLSNIINSMPSVLVGVDQDGGVTHWNREAERITGVKANDALGSRLPEVFPRLAPEMKNVQEAVKQRKSRRQEKIPSIVDGEIRYSDVTVYPLISNGMEGAVIRIDDVTESVRIEEMMIQSEKMLSVGGLAAGMAHEINNPLAGILQNVQVIRNRIKGELPKNLRVAEESGLKMSHLETYMQQRGIYDMIEAIMESGRRASKIVNNMLSFSRKGKAHFTDQDISGILDQTLELASNDYDLKKRYDFRKIKIDRIYDPDLPPVSCEASMIQQVFFNIFKNGAQAMAGNKNPEKEPCFTLRTAKEMDKVRIEIEDNGPGLDPSTRKRIFEPFFTTKGEGMGTGLGLSVSYFIITESHGGTMSVESAPHEGTRFVICLPLQGKAKS